MAFFFAVTSRGTEAVLADELRSLGIALVEEGRGGVAFGSTLEHAYLACLWSRIASRILMPLASFEVNGAQALYDGVHALEWPQHVDPKRTLAVDVAGKDSPAGPPHFVALKTKDAIVDRVREVLGSRPSIDTERPDLRVNVHLSGSKVTIGLDLSGRGFHERGLDRSGFAAPLKENLAAAILRIAGWHSVAAEAPLLDPMCGSGTLLIEASWMALDVAPGLRRERIGAQGWKGHDARLWERLRAEARQRRGAAKARPILIAGTDAARKSIESARINLKRAGLERNVRVEQRELRDAEPFVAQPGLVVTNPPYGERLGEAGELGPLYELLGDVLKRRFGGWSAWIFTGNPALAKRIGLKTKSKHVLYNGPIECRLLEFPITASKVAAEGPGWRKPSCEASSFVKRLTKNRRQIEEWASEEGLTCYRLYDSDVPEYNLAVDWYDGAVRVEEYAPPRKVDPAAAERHLRDAVLVIPEALAVDAKDVVLRVRRKRAPGEQHHGFGDAQIFREVREGDLRFLVNLHDYLDTGLFLDDRLLRRRIREQAKGKDFLNLFAYTCTASVAAAAGGARSTTSIDLSNGYLAWGRRNFAQNDLEANPRDRFLRADALQWLARGGDRRTYGVILLAPPSFSKSKGMEADFDIQRDHAALLRDAARLLAPGGEILFVTHRRDFALDEGAAHGWRADDITSEVTPRDFERRPRFRAWSVERVHAAQAAAKRLAVRPPRLAEGERRGDRRKSR